MVSSIISVIIIKYNIRYATGSNALQLNFANLNQKRRPSSILMNDYF